MQWQLDLIINKVKLIGMFLFDCSRGESGTDAEHDQVTEEAEHQVQEEKKRPKSPKRQHDEEVCGAPLSFLINIRYMLL